MDRASPVLATRTAIKIIEAGRDEDVLCPADKWGCGNPVRFTVRVPLGLRKEVIVNIYHRGKWVRVEHFHLACYIRAFMPYGRPKDLDDSRLVELEAAIAACAPDAAWERLMEAVIAARKAKLMANEEAACSS